MKINRGVSRSIVAFAGVVAVSAVAATAASARPTPQTAPGDLLDPRTYASGSRLYTLPLSILLHAGAHCGRSGDIENLRGAILHAPGEFVGGDQRFNFGIALAKLLLLGGEFGN